MNDVTEIADIIKREQEVLAKAQLLEKKVEALYTEAKDLRTKAINMCEHPAAKKSSVYSNGGYDYVSSVTINIYCVVCGKLMRTYDDPNHKGMHS